MTKIEFREDLLAPDRELRIEYVGKNAVWILGSALKLLQNTLKVSAVNLREDRIDWDVSGDPPSFRGEWRGKRIEDQWTTTWIRIRAQGNHGKESGKVKIWIRGWIFIKYEYNNPFEKMLWFIFKRNFYHKQLRAYLENSKGDLLSIKDQIKKAYEISREEYA